MKETNKSFNKIFCIGLHKTGTTSLHQFFKNCGFNSLHDTYWSKKPIPKKNLKTYTAFSDGGGHFWDEEFEFGSNHEIRLLDENYPNSKFILNTRPLKSWTVSKLMHAGWDRGTEFQEPKEVKHDDWQYKSIDVVCKWIINRQKYHESIQSYFSDRQNDILHVDVTKDQKSVEKIIRFLSLENEILITDRLSLWDRGLNTIGFRDKLRVTSKMPYRNRKKKDHDQKEFCQEIYEEAIKMLGNKNLAKNKVFDI